MLNLKHEAMLKEALAFREDVRSEILRAALELMSEGGLGALSMREVARRAGVSHQAPYHYFADREAILAELAREGFQILTDRMKEALKGVNGERAAIRAMGEAYVTFALDYPPLFQLMFRCELVDLSKYPDAKAVADEAFNTPVRVITEAYGADDPTIMTRMLSCWSVSHGLATLLLEKKLGDSFGETPEAQQAGIRSVIDFYAGCVAKDA
jgi:AcrR family transcriptional regulator